MLKKIKKYYFNIFLIKKYTPYSNPTPIRKEIELPVI